MAKKYPTKIVYKLFPFGLVSTFDPHTHFPLDDLPKLIAEMKSHPQTHYFLKNRRQRITFDEKNIFINGREFKYDDHKATAVIEQYALEKVRTVIFDDFNFGYVDLRNPSKHFTEVEVARYISENRNKKFFLHDRNVRLTINQEGILIKTNRPVRRYSFYTILVLLCIAVPFFTGVGMMFGTIYLITREEKGKRPGVFNNGFTMNLWYHNRGRLFASRNYWGEEWKSHKTAIKMTNKKYDESNCTTAGMGLTDESYQSALNLLSSDDLYTMMMGTFLYSEMTLPLSQNDKFYLPAQQYKDPEGEEDGTHIRHMVPIYNLYSRNIRVQVRKTDDNWQTEWNDNTAGWKGKFEFFLSYDFEYSSWDMTSAATYHVQFAGKVRLTQDFLVNLDWTNNRLYNWGMTANDLGGGVKLTYDTLITKGEPAEMQNTTEWNDSAVNYTWDLHVKNNNDPTGPIHEDVPTEAYLPSIINTDPNYTNKLIYTPNVYINWMIDHQRDGNWD